MTLAIIIDIVVVSLLLIGLIYGFKKGLLALIFNRWRKLTSIVISAFASKFVSAILTKRIFADLFATWVLNWAELEDVSSAESPEALLKEVPTFIRLVAEHFGYNLDQYAQRAYESGEGMYHTVIADLSYPLVNAVVYVLCCIALYFVIRLFLYLFFEAMEELFELPVIKQLNTVLGACVGLSLTAALVWLLCQAGIRILAIDSLSKYSLIADFSIEKSYVARYIYDFNPLAFLLSIKH